ncbi:hypothetical protein Tco_0712084 [Tanacetum coccineum]
MSCKLVVTSFNEFKESDRTSPSSASELMARDVRHWRLVSKDWRFGSDLKASWELRSFEDPMIKMESSVLNWTEGSDNG